MLKPVNPSMGLSVMVARPRLAGGPSSILVEVTLEFTG